ncbi:hypothetical protein J5X84_37705 [Streptosporangiaceae bacterium NEAU-GS5]|nr:hypothetical protein [Streptosporangiaceae bacterium NEAU-GS5]
MTHRSRSAVLVLATLVAVGGCGSDQKKPRQQPLQPLSLQEQTSSVASSSNGYIVNWAGVLRNANRWHFGENAVATVTAVDAAGQEVVHMEQPLDAIPPGGTLPFSGEAVANAKPVNVKIGYRDAAWRQAARIPSAFKPFPLYEVATEPLDRKSYLVTGYVGDPFIKAAGSLVVTALLRDAEGKLIGGGSAFVDDVTSKLRRRFVITVDSVSGGKAVKTDVMARTWGSTAKPYEDLALGGAVPADRGRPATPPFAKDRGYQVASDRRP